MDIDKFLRICILVMNHSNEKILNTSNLQYSFQILYLDDIELCQNAIQNGTKYLIEYKYKSKSSIQNYLQYENIIRNFLNNFAIQTNTNKIKLSSNSIAYFCGLIDTINNCVQNFLDLED